ncbi:MAG: hypothetical protein FWG10_01850 [Eubacteriaceae bacterium]|nr:hypothetical protein [Eubacteriaceae bacterium]
MASAISFASNMPSISLFFFQALLPSFIPSNASGIVAVLYEIPKFLASSSLVSLSVRSSFGRNSVFECMTSLAAWTFSS